MKDNFNNNLNPYWITGFVDGEGCFLMNICYKKNIHKWEVRPAFQIRLHKRDLNILSSIKSFFNVGNIYIYQREVIYKVQKKEDLVNVIIPHFNKYLLMTEKQNDFIKQIFTTENSFLFNYTDIIRIIELKSILNRGFSDQLKISFPNISIIKRPANRPITAINPYWFAGFFSGEGCFMVKIERKLNKVFVRLVIDIGQHPRDEVLINYFVKFFDCGYAKNVRNNEFTSFNVYKFIDISTKIIPFFNKYKIIVEKSKDFQDFCQVAKMINNKDHLTKQGIIKIITIRSQMNKNRYYVAEAT